MNLLRNSIVLRWVLAWLVASVLLAGATSFLVVYLHKDSMFGRDFSSQFLSILLFSAPWFLWGEILSRFVHKQREYSSIWRIISVLVIILLFVSIVFWTGLLMMDW